MTTKYYKDIRPFMLSSTFIETYGKIQIYKITFNKKAPKYAMSVFHVKKHKWIQIRSYYYIPTHFKLINKKELFLELL